MRPLMAGLGGPLAPELVNRLAWPLRAFAARFRRARSRQDAPRVLVLRLDEIGDLVLTSPLLRELRRRLPGAWITLVAKPRTLNLAQGCPHVDEVLAAPVSTFQTSGNLRRFARLLAFAGGRLWRRRFDIALVPRWDTDYYLAGWLAVLSGAPRRIGFSESVSPEKALLNRGFDRFFTEVLEDGQPCHEVLRGLAILARLCDPPFDDSLESWARPEDEEHAARLLEAEARGNAVVVALCPGARVDQRRWPIERYAVLGRWLQERFTARLLVLGGPGEEALGRRLREELGPEVIDTVGRATLRQAAALLARCALYIGSDTGPMHLAAAAGTPVVEISCHPESGAPGHPHSPVRFGPWRVAHRVLRPRATRPPCRDTCTAREPHCIRGVGAPEVEQAAAELLSG